MRTITNDYRDAKIMDLGSASEKGPYLVTQTGVAPNEPASRTRMFVLRPDGQWADFNAYACQDKPEAIDELIFPTINDVLAIFNTFRGRPRVLDLPIDKDGLKAWLERTRMATRFRLPTHGPSDIEHADVKSAKSSAAKYLVKTFPVASSTTTGQE